MADVHEVLFLIPASLTRPYFSALYCECEGAIYQAFGDRVRPIWRCVPKSEEEFDSDAIVAILRREFRQSGNRIRLLVVVPTSSKELTAAVARTSRDHGIPVIALTLPFRQRKRFLSFNLPVPPVVLCDSAKGSQRLGAAARLEYARRSPGAKCPVVVLIPGDLHRIDSINRLKYFQTGISQPDFHPEFMTTKECGWKRRIARTEMHRLIEECRPKGKYIDIVFAANDEMALGARDAIRQSLLENRGVANNCLVYGFDATQEVVSLIRDNDVHMKGTIEQNLRAMAMGLVGVIEKHLDCNCTLTSNDNVSVDPKVVLASIHEARLNIELTWPNAPALDMNSDDWVDDTMAAQIEGLDARTLRHYRKRTQGASSPDIGLGRDRFGRVWRKAPQSTVYYYLAMTLLRSGGILPPE